MGRRLWRPFAILAATLMVPACGSHYHPMAGPIHLSPASLSFIGSIAGPNPPSQEVQLTNLGGFIPRRTLSILTWTASSDKPWLKYTPEFGTTGAGTDLFTISVVPQQSEAWTMDTNLTGAPAAGAEDFSMVWTGSEILIWGGAVASGPTLSNVGYRYDPTANAWIGTLSMVGAPSPRWGHTAIWTGKEMIVWGGSDSSGTRLNDGYRYDPATDTWSGPISTTSAPEARRAHTAVWTSTEMIVWGGEVAGLPVNTGARYNPKTDIWSPVTMIGAPAIRWHHAAVWTGTEMIVWGGFDGVNGIDTGMRYSPSTDTWGAVTSTLGTPPGRLTTSTIWTGSEMIVFGGQATQGSPGSNTGGRYDPLADSWNPTTTINAPTSRYGHAGVWTGNEMIIWGGAPSFQNTGKHYLPQIALTVGVYAASFAVSDPRAANSPQHVDVSYQVTP